MTKTSWQTRPFRTGRHPVEDWIKSLNPKARAEVLRKIALLEQLGTQLAAPHSRVVGNGLWELRARVGNNIYRVIYFHWKGRTFGLLHGFTKKTERTEQADIDLAEARRTEWLSRQPKQKRR